MGAGVLCLMPYAMHPRLQKSRNTVSGRIFSTHRFQHLNPRTGYVYHATVWLDEFDSMGMLHNNRYAVHVERASSEWLRTAKGLDPSDFLIAIKAHETEFTAPFTGEGSTLSVRLTLKRVGTTSMTVGFHCLSLSADGTGTLHARGTRTMVKISPSDGRPAPWSIAFRSAVTGEPA